MSEQAKTFEDLFAAAPLERASGPRVRRIDLERDIATVAYEDRLTVALRAAGGILQSSGMRHTAQLVRLAAAELARRDA